jgi:hypothetical protein
MEMECAGKCGKQWNGTSLPTKGYRWGDGDHIRGWVCDVCWAKGNRTTGHHAENKAQPTTK